MLSIEHVIANAAPADALQLVGFCRRRLDAAEAGIVADRYEAGASDSQVEDLFTRDGKTSKAKARKTASRGKAVHANPAIATSSPTATCRLNRPMCWLMLRMSRMVRRRVMRN